jgi:mpaB/rubber oxygenase-like protein
VTRGRYGAWLDDLRRAGDPSADAVIGELARTQQIRAVSRVLRHLVDNDQAVPDELPPSIAHWLHETAALPEWVDHDRFEGGCRLVVEHGPQVCVILATASLAYCYAGYPDVKLLTFSGRLDHDAVRRVGETAQFVLSVMAPGSLESGGRGIRKIQKVRLLHAAIRHLITTSHRWDTAGDGVPICQEDLAGTLVSFSSVVVDALRKLGGRVDDEEAEDYYYYRWQASMGRALDRAQSARGPIGSLTKLVGAGMLNQRVAEMAGGRSASFSIPVPIDLEWSWTASGVFPAIDAELVELAQTQPV